MGFERTYKLKCDGCGKVHALDKFFTGGYSTPRRARAAAKHDGWQRRNVGAIHEYSDGSGKWQEGGPYRDFCPPCAKKEDDAQPRYLTAGVEGGYAIQE